MSIHLYLEWWIERAKLIQWMTTIFKTHYASLQWNRNSVDRSRPMGLLFITAIDLVWRMMKRSPSAGPPKGQKLCRNKTCKVFSVLDPHPSCTHCLPPRVCSRELPCEFCSPLSGEQWEEWERVLAKQKSYQARKKAGTKEAISRPPPPYH